MCGPVGRVVSGIIAGGIIEDRVVDGTKHVTGIVLTAYLLFLTMG